MVTTGSIHVAICGCLACVEAKGLRIARLEAENARLREAARPNAELDGAPRAQPTCARCMHAAHPPGLCDYGLADGECPCDDSRAQPTRDADALRWETIANNDNAQMWRQSRRADEAEAKVTALEAERAKLSAVAEKVPHLFQLEYDKYLVNGAIVTDEADRLAHEPADCIELGGRCAFDALLAGKREGGGE